MGTMIIKSRGSTYAVGGLLSPLTGAMLSQYLEQMTGEFFESRLGTYFGGDPLGFSRCAWHLEPPCRGDLEYRIVATSNGQRWVEGRGKTPRKELQDWVAGYRALQNFFGGA
jgi:hypothetical protein